MGKSYETIDDELARWLVRQPVFFVATAPLAATGHVNLSPKGLDSLAVLDGRTVAYLDLTGSGVETIAHLRENGRITLMFCAFDGPPRIVRLYGRGEALQPGDADFDDARGALPGRARGRPACARSCASRSRASPTPAATACRGCASRARATSSCSGPSARAARASGTISARETPRASTGSPA